MCEQIRLDAYHRRSGSRITMPGTRSPSSSKLNSAAYQGAASLAWSTTASTGPAPSAARGTAAAIGSAARPMISARRPGAAHDGARLPSALGALGEPEHREPFVIAEDLRPHRIGVLEHQLGLLGKVSRHRVAQRVDVIAEIVRARDRRVVAHVGREPGDRDVLDPLGSQDLIEAGAAERRRLDARREEDVLVAGAGKERLIVRGLARPGLPGLAQDLATVEAARIGRVDLAIVAGIAFG